MSAGYKVDKYELGIDLDTLERTYVHQIERIVYNEQKIQIEKYDFITDENKKNYNFPDHINFISINNDGTVKDIYKVPAPLEDFPEEEIKSANEIQIKYNIESPGEVKDIYRMYVAQRNKFTGRHYSDELKNLILDIYKNDLTEQDVIIIEKLFKIIPNAKIVNFKNKTKKKFYIYWATEEQVEEFLKMEL